MSTTSEIRLSVTMDDDGVTGIAWEADDSREPGTHRADAMILALWDPAARNAMRIDLWTKGLSVDDMNDFYFQTLLSMADTYQKATNDKVIAAEFKLFAQRFADQAAKAAAAKAGLP